MSLLKSKKFASFLSWTGVLCWIAAIILQFWSAQFMSAQQIKDLNQPITIALYGVVFLTFVIGMIVDFEAGKAIPKSTKFMRLISILFVVAILIFTIVPMFGQIAENNFEHGWEKYVLAIQNSIAVLGFAAVFSTAATGLLKR